jgi:Flp pilus assembly protein TadG
MFRRDGDKRLSFLRRFRRDEQGSTAVEFALVALPLFALMFASIEGALVFWTNQVLDEAVAQASRTLYTGSFQQANLTVPAAQIPEQFKAAVCSRVKGLFNCSEIKIDVQTYDSFPAGIPQPIITDADGTRRLDPAFGQFNPPGPYKITVVRAAIEYPVFVSLLGANASNLTGNKRLIMATAAFRTEQYL